MYSNLSKNVEKIFSAFYKLHKFTKTSIKYGTLACFTLLILGSVLIFLNHSGLNYDSNFEFIATSIIKSGFTNLTIVIIGAILIDYTFKHE
ncbi:MAG: hypothetical protein Q7R95_02490 [bacterium]|nr:hypothetical protein [bacterium]